MTPEERKIYCRNRYLLRRDEILQKGREKYQQKKNESKENTKEYSVIKIRVLKPRIVSFD